MFPGAPTAKRRSNVLAVADIAIGTSIDIATTARVDLAKHEHVARWYARLRERPSWMA